MAGQRENWLCDWISGSRGREFHREGSQEEEEEEEEEEEGSQACQANATHSTHNWRRDRGKRDQVCATLSLTG